MPPAPALTPAPARVVVLDDRPAARVALRLAARGAGVVVVGEAAATPDAVAAACALRPDLVFVRLGRQDHGDADVVRRLRRETRAAVLVSVATDDRLAVVAALRAGAGGVVQRDAPMRDVVRALVTLGRGTAPLLLRRALRPLDLHQEDRMLTPKVIELRRGCAHPVAKHRDAAPAAAPKG